METAQSKKALWTGRIMSILAILFLTMDAVMKLIKAQPSIEATVELGYMESQVFILGVILIICTILYTIPRTTVLGALLLTAYLGGAVATHFRLGNPLFSHTLFPTYLGILIWGGLLLRNNQLKIILPGNQEN